MKVLVGIVQHKVERHIRGGVATRKVLIPYRYGTTEVFEERRMLYQTEFQFLIGMV